MSAGAEAALEDAVMARLAGDAGVKVVLGDPVRVLAQASARPAYPYLEVVRHESVAGGGAAADSSEHRLDLAVVARDGGRDEAREALAAVRAALAGTALGMTGHRCVLLLPVFADLTPARSGGYRALLRMKAVVEAA
ncbi:MAG: DUF3168 domain-containing protein [Alphaproteobacteria bacterium]|nr:DUF3168 domain-containing protein [Alphaproteobacteria bacterium]